MAESATNSLVGSRHSVLQSRATHSTITSGTHMGSSWVDADEDMKHDEKASPFTSSAMSDTAADDYDFVPLDDLGASPEQQNQQQQPQHVQSHANHTVDSAPEKMPLMGSSIKQKKQEDKDDLDAFSALESSLPISLSGSRGYDMLSDTSESQFLMPVIDHTISPASYGQKAFSENDLRQRKQQRHEQLKRVHNSNKDKRNETPQTTRAATPDGNITSVTTLIRNMDVLGPLIRYSKAQTPLIFGFVLFGALFWLSWAVASSSTAADATMADDMPLPPPPLAEFDRLMASHAHFEEILAARADSLALPAAMKRGEATIRDLRTLVTVSTLRSRQQLLHEFDGFVAESRAAANDLSAFNAHVDSAADFILSAARWTRRVLGEIETERLVGSGGGSSSYYRNTGLVGWVANALGLAMTSTAEQRVVGRFVEHAEAVEERMHGLLLEAEALLMQLHGLEGRLDAMGEAAAREGVGTAAARRDVLAALWTRLGGNRRRLDRFDAELAVLRQVGQQRRTAVRHVADAAVRLRAMEAELAALRERVAAVPLLAGRPDDVPIGLHLDNIERGVVRLEASRADSRRRFEEFRERVRDGAGDGLEIEGKKKGIESN